MRLESAMATLCAVAVCSGITATAALAQSVRTPRDVTFERTSLPPADLPLQHGIKNYITLSMVEAGGSKAISIQGPPPFPLIATLQYRDREGVKREATFACDYRC